MGQTTYEEELRPRKSWWRAISESTAKTSMMLLECTILFIIVIKSMQCLED